MTRYQQALKSVASRLVFLVLAALLFSTPSRAEEGSIIVELNKTEDTDEGCRPLFLFDNQSGHQLSRFQVDLVLFDVEGVHSKQILLDMAPLYEGKKTVASFLLSNIKCDQIGSMLVNDLPDCRNSGGDPLDCLALLKVASKSDITLEK